MTLNRLKDLCLILGLLTTSYVFAIEAVPDAAHHKVIPTIEKGIINKYYMGLGWHDGTKIGGFFFPQVKQGNHWTWWLDTGSIFYGSGTGFRQVLNSHWFSQDWFWGAYFYYEYPTWTLPNHLLRLNLGAELAASELGQITINLYGNPSFNPVAFLKEPYNFEDIKGMSVKLSSDYFKKLKPFIAISAHQVADNSGNSIATQELIQMGLRIYWTKLSKLFQ